MPRLEVPLLHRTLWATGDVLLRAELTLLLKTGRGTWQPLIFQVDTGSEMTTMSAYEALQLALPMPVVAARGIRHSQTGLEIRSGYLQAQVAGLDATEYAFPCFFLGDPHQPPVGQAHALPRKLLGLSGVVKKLRLSFDGDATPAAWYGHLVVEKR